MNLTNNYLRLLVIFFAYYLSGRIGLLFATHTEQVTLIWPPTGIAMFALLLWGKNMWPAIWLAALLININLNTSFIVSLVIATGNTLGPYLAFRGLKYFDFDLSFYRAKDVLLYLSIAVIVGMSINASIGTFALIIGDVLDSKSLLKVWLTWWLGGALGALIVGTALLTLLTEEIGFTTSKYPQEMIFAWSGLFIIALLTLSPILPFAKGLAPIFCFPFVMWLGLRQNPAQPALATLCLSVLAIWGAASNISPFIDLKGDVQIGRLWSFLFTLAIVSQLITVLRKESQHVLETSKKNEQLLRTIIDEIPDVFVLKDHKGDFLLCNQTIAKLYNTKPEAMVGKYDGDFGVPKEMADFFRQNVLQIMADGHTEIVFEDSRDAATGEIRHFKSIKKPLKDSDGNNQILVIAHDITDMQNTQKRLLESEQKLNVILDNVDAYIYLKDKEGRYLFANQKVRDLWQVENNEIIGFGDDKFFDEKTVANIRHNDKRVLEGKETVRTEEVNTVPQTGKTAIYQSTKLPIMDESGDIYALCGISIDITKQKNTEKALQENEQRFRIAGKAAYDLIYEWDVKSNVLQWFSDVDRILGYQSGEISNGMDSWLHLIHPDDLKKMSDAVEVHRESTKPIEYSYRIKHNDGTYRHWEDHALPLIDNGKPSKWIGVCKDITLEKEHELQLEHRAYHDTLTNLPNRNLLSDRLRQAMLQDDRRQQQLAVAYIDLDGFKEVNDQYGHKVGDKLLITIAERFEQILREGDTVARIGGDEFVAILIDMQRSDSVIPLLKRILDVASKPVHIEKNVLQVSASIGVTIYPQDEENDADQLLRQADQAMYKAKLEGKNQYFFFDSEQDRSLRGRQESIERIQEALSNNEFVLYYQPKVNMKSGKLIGVEALIRWLHPVDGLLPPYMFLPLTEEHPLGIAIDNWVLTTALSQMEEWRQQGIELQLSINISAQYLQQKHFIDDVKHQLELFPDCDPNNLQFEILESSALDDMFYISKVMRDCQTLGVDFALDDFGTGYSSLTYLKHLPASTLKIDRTFVRDMLDDPDDLAILEGIMGMASAFRLAVVAEGVESIEHGDLLLQLGCEQAQGFEIARPMSTDQFFDWLKMWQPSSSWKSQRQISRDDLSLLFAAIEHRAWVQAISDYISGSKDSIPAISTSECRFGQWMLSEGDKRYIELTTYQSIITLHEEVHRLGDEICHLKGEPEKAQGKLKQLYQLRDQILEQLERLLIEAN